MKNLHLILLSCIGFFMIACQTEPEQAETEDTPEEIVTLDPIQLQEIGIKTAKPEYHSISKLLKVNGLLDVPPQQKVSMSIPLGGFVRSVNLYQGSRVSKGQVLAVVENPEYIKLQQEYLEAKNQEQIAALEAARQAELSKDQINAEKTRQQAEANLQACKIKKKALEARLKSLMNNPEQLKPEQISARFELRSPIDGFLVEIMVSPGQFLQANDLAFELVNTDHLHVELSVYEQDILDISKGQAIRFRLSDQPQWHEAEVFLIGRKLETNRTIRVHGHLKKENPSWLPGMFVTAEIDLKTDTLLCLPESAFLEYKGVEYVFVQLKEKEANSFALTPVKAGPRENGFRAVYLQNDELNEQLFVTEGAYYLLAKLKNAGEEE